MGGRRLVPCCAGGRGGVGVEASYHGMRCARVVSHHMSVSNKQELHGSRVGRGFGMLCSNYCDVV